MSTRSRTGPGVVPGWQPGGSSREVAAARRAAEDDSALGKGYVVLPTAHGVIVAVMDRVEMGRPPPRRRLWRSRLSPRTLLLPPLSASPSRWRWPTEPPTRAEGRWRDGPVRSPEGVSRTGVGRCGCMGWGRRSRRRRSCFGVRWPEPEPQGERLSGGAGRGCTQEMGQQTSTGESLRDLKTARKGSETASHLSAKPLRFRMLPYGGNVGGRSVRRGRETAYLKSSRADRPQRATSACKRVCRKARVIGSIRG